MGTTIPGPGCPGQPHQCPGGTVPDGPTSCTEPDCNTICVSANCSGHLNMHVFSGDVETWPGNGCRCTNNGIAPGVKYQHPKDDPCPHPTYTDWSDLHDADYYDIDGDGYVGVEAEYLRGHTDGGAEWTEYLDKLCAAEGIGGCAGPTGDYTYRAFWDGCKCQQQIDNGGGPVEFYEPFCPSIAPIRRDSQDILALSDCCYSEEVIIECPSGATASLEDSCCPGDPSPCPPGWVWNETAGECQAWFDLDFARSKDGALVVAYVPWACTHNLGQLVIWLFDDQLPPETESSQVLEAEGVQGVSLGFRGDRTLDLFYTKDEKVWHRSSADGGASWSAATELLALAGADRVMHAKPWSGIGAYPLLVTGDAGLYAYVIRLNAAGDGWETVGAGTLLTASAPAGNLQALGSSRYLLWPSGTRFIAVTEDEPITPEGPAPSGTAYGWLDRRTGQYVTVHHNGAAHYVTTGELDDDGTGLVSTGNGSDAPDPQTLPALASVARIQSRGDGGWELLHVNAAGEGEFVRTPYVRPTGKGSWA